jgi:hypothetical protein
MDDLPVLGEFYQAVHEDLATRFHPEMERLQQVLSEGSENFRAALEGSIRQYSGGEVDATVIGLDASSRMVDAGEVAAIIACGVAVANRPGIKPMHVLRSAFGTASEDLGRAKSAITVCAEIDAALAAVEVDGATILWDGGFSALNLEINKAVSALEDVGHYIKPDVDRLLTGKAPLAKDLFGEHGKRLVSVAKKGISRQYAKQIEKKLALPTELGLSDKAILGRVLQAGEYTVPAPYSSIFGSDKGFGVPNSDMKWLADFYSKIRVTYFKPHPWSPPMRVEFQEPMSVQTVLGIVMAQTATRAIMEPLQIYMADLLANQCSHAMKLYGDVNARRYPDLYKPTRTISRK